MEIKVIIDDSNHQVISESGDTILDTLIKSNLDVPFSCQVGHCSVCKCKLLSGDIIVEDDSILTNGEKRNGFILACQTYPKSDVSISYDY